MSELTFTGGLNAAAFGNQQFTVRNFTISNAKNAINMIYDWGWLTVSYLTLFNALLKLTRLDFQVNFDQELQRRRQHDKRQPNSSNCRLSHFHR